jgi:arsenite transporter
MSAPAAASVSPLRAFERYLTLWVALAMAGGALAGNLWPAPFAALARLEVAHVNLPVAALIWAMIYPMMVSVDFAALRHVGDKPRGLAVTLTVNWLVKPFTMAALGVLFFRYLYAGLVPPADAQQYIAGMILLGAAPCTAMVFVWSQLCRGDATYTLVQVAVNDLVMIFAFAPIVALLLGVTAVPVPWQTLLASVLLYVVIPLAAGALTRRRLTRRAGPAAVAAFTARIRPVTIGALIATVALLFAFQGPTLAARPAVIGLIALPLVLQTLAIFAIAYAWARAWRLPIAIGAPAALIGTSNFFELAVAVAISVYGLGSGAALATVVGVLVEVPVMLALVRTVEATRTWYGAPAQQRP